MLYAHVWVTRWEEERERGEAIWQLLFDMYGSWRNGGYERERKKRSKPRINPLIYNSLLLIAVCARVCGFPPLARGKKKKKKGNKETRLRGGGGGGSHKQEETRAVIYSQNVTVNTCLTKLMRGPQRDRDGGKETISSTTHTFCSACVPWMKFKPIPCLQSLVIL